MALAPQEVGDRIRKARIAKGWTHEDLKNEMGVDLRTVQRWQKGWDPKKGKSLLPRLHTLMKLADKLEVERSYFVELEDDELTLAAARDEVRDATLARLEAKMDTALLRLARLEEAPARVSRSVPKRKRASGSNG